MTHEAAGGCFFMTDSMCVWVETKMMVSRNQTHPGEVELILVLANEANRIRSDPQSNSDEL